MISYFKNITFLHPTLLWLIPILCLVCAAHYYFVHLKQTPALLISHLPFAPAPAATLKQHIHNALPILQYLCLVSLLAALARPQSSIQKQNIDSNGIDIIMCMDISGSMLAQDFKPNRLEAAKQVAQQFVGNRPTDRIGLVVFSGESFTQCPLTTDHTTLNQAIIQTKSGWLTDGTAIGTGLATSIERLRRSNSPTKIAILLTDGEDSGNGTIDPETSIELAKKFGVKVYTIGIGSIGKAPFPFQDPVTNEITYKEMPVNIDEPLLTKMATQTGGLYFRATNQMALQNIYNKIDQLEKTKINIQSFKKTSEEFLPFAFVAFVLLSLVFVLKFTVLKGLFQ
jgi:Ca-activated chloride channel family protein